MNSVPVKKNIATLFFAMASLFLFAQSSPCEEYYIKAINGRGDLFKVPAGADTVIQEFKTDEYMTPVQFLSRKGTMDTFENPGILRAFIEAATIRDSLITHAVRYQVIPYGCKDSFDLNIYYDDKLYMACQYDILPEYHIDTVTVFDPETYATHTHVEKYYNAEPHGRWLIGDTNSNRYLDLRFEHGRFRRITLHEFNFLKE